MAKFITGAICNRAIIDKQSGLVSLIDIILGGAVSKFPFEAPLFVIFCQWMAEDGKKVKTKFKHVIYDPNGKELLSSEHTCEAKGICTVTLSDVDGFLAEGPGVYIVATQIRRDGKWATVAEHPITLSLRKERAPKAQVES